MSREGQVRKCGYYQEVGRELVEFIQNTVLLSSTSKSVFFSSIVSCFNPSSSPKSARLHFLFPVRFQSV
ncbi:hypothetical protein L5515_015865 [Caenorhabditis briggsae]|uniref:Uncharacterized protein n=1 Tax=Caenorhabditis briggsae TaxID=6238 RepID=A0AAE9EIF6_CAEBR|nr:hypothetical protein L5515_015865 [Caenorhabditis briggsae]